MPTNPKTALYCRTSTDRQDTGLEAQLRALNLWCETKSIVDRIEFLEKGVSGAKTSRPELDRMLRMTREGKIKTIVVYSFSRLSRSLKHMILMADEFKELNVDLVSVKDAIDTTTAMGRAMFSIIGVFAQLERDLAAERIKTGLKNAVAKGKRLGRPPRARGKSDEVMVLASKGMSPEDIALELQISRSSVFRALQSKAKLS